MLLNPFPNKPWFLFKHDLNPLPNDKFLDLSKLKSFADNEVNVAKMMISAFEKPENIVGKGENAGYQHFLLSLKVFKSLLL